MTERAHGPAAVRSPGRSKRRDRKDPPKLHCTSVLQVHLTIYCVQRTPASSVMQLQTCSDEAMTQLTNMHRV